MIDKLMDTSKENIIIWLAFIGLIEESITDSLTHLLNRRGFQQTLEHQKQISKRYKRPLSLILFDICSLKNINDKNGHIEGDKIIQIIANILTKTVRESDVACRIGGDEFALILPETNYDQAIICKDRILEAVKKYSLELHYGLSTYNSNDLFEQADQDLIKNKKLKCNT